MTPEERWSNTIIHTFTLIDNGKLNLNDMGEMSHDDKLLITNLVHAFPLIC